MKFSYYLQTYKKKIRAKNFSPGPGLCNRSIIYIQTKNLEWRSSCPKQSSIIEK